MSENIKSVSSGFVATHVIQSGTRRWYVRAEQAEAGVQFLYTNREWDACEPADWTYDEVDGLKFCGSLNDAILDGATIETFAQCEHTASDGWNDDGMPGPGASFL